jgi:hypothetical protein
MLETDVAPRSGDTASNSATFASPTEDPRDIIERIAHYIARLTADDPAADANRAARGFLQVRVADARDAQAALAGLPFVTMGRRPLDATLSIL